MTRIWHASVTCSRITDAIARHHTTLDNPGICLACGADAEGCEPDACEYTCEVCGECAVYGAEELGLMLL